MDASKRRMPMPVPGLQIPEDPTGRRPRSAGAVSPRRAGPRAHSPYAEANSPHGFGKPGFGASPSWESPTLVSRSTFVSQSPSTTFVSQSSTFASQSSTLVSESTFISQPTSSASETSTNGTGKPIWRTALSEAQHFASGLIARPHESTKHYTIVRHTYGLVWYRGSSTSVAVTVFADRPLPPDRTLWLQRKGFSGNLGMNLKALVGGDGGWLDVTPSLEAQVANLSETDERAWQRDMRRFTKKAPREVASHTPRETFVVRIPAAAADGYFRLLLCTGGGADNKKKKILCPSPVFRVASTSTDASILRGAGLRTMPLEIGIKVASTIGQRAVGHAVAPAAVAVQSRVGKFMPSAQIRQATHVAYSSSGLEHRVGHMNAQYEESRGVAYDPFLGTAHTAQVVGPDEGPEKPFPIKFYGKVKRGTGSSTRELGIPTANLQEVPEEVQMRLKGVFFGWAHVAPGKGMEHIDQEWHEAIVTIAPSSQAPPSVVARNEVVVHMVHDFGYDQSNLTLNPSTEGVETGIVGPTGEITIADDKLQPSSPLSPSPIIVSSPGSFVGSRLRVILMGYLRSAGPPLNFTDLDAIDAAIDRFDLDVITAAASLQRDNWAPDETITRMKTLKKARSFNERYVSVRGQVQNRIDSLPAHWAGVRTEGAAMRDGLLGKGGYFVKR